MLVQQWAGERPLGRRFAQHCVALRPKDFLPFGRRVIDGKAQRTGGLAGATGKDQAARRGGTRKGNERASIEMHLRNCSYNDPVTGNQHLSMAA